MKKLLSVLAAIGIVSSSAVSVVACGTKKEDGKSKPEEPKKDITQVVQDFEQDVTKIWSEHYEKEVSDNLIALETMEEDNEFLNKHNIQKFSKPENKDKLTSQDKQQLTNDIEKLFKVKLLEEKLNELKKVNKYKIILDEVDSVFKHVELLFNDNFEINSGEIVEGTYIGNLIVDYNIVVQYKGLVDVEKFKQSGTLKYTSTESEFFKKVGDVMYKNIAKDMFTSSETEKYVNLKWSDIKKNSDDSDAYASSNLQLKKYYNENSEFHETLLKTIKDKYFNKYFPSLNISYDKKSIYKTDNFAEKNRNQLIINSFRFGQGILEDVIHFELKKSEDYKKVSEILQGNKTSIHSFLIKDFFNDVNLSRFRTSYKIVQDRFLDTFLNKVEVSEYQKTKYYDLAVAMGYVEFVGPSIKIGTGESTYNHQLPDFKLAISYSINGETDNIRESLVNFSLKLFDIYKFIYKPRLEDSNTNYFKFHYGYADENNFIWKQEKDKEISDIDEIEINNLLVNFSSSYYSAKKSQLNSVNISENVFNNKNIYFETYVWDEEPVNEVRFVVNSEHKNYFTLINDNKINGQIFKSFFYIQFNLFNLFKIRIYFDENFKTSEKMQRIF